MSNKPLFSILITTYNHAHLISKTLDSIEAQTFNDYEVIIVNNFSTDNTLDVIARYNNPKFKVINYNNRGNLGVARNVGISNAQGEFIAAVDSDDWWYPTKLEEVSKYTDNYDVIYHDLEVHNPEGTTGRIFRGRQIKRPFILDMLLNANPIPQSASVYRKTIATTVGGVSQDDDIFGVEDFDFWIRISEVTTMFKYIPKTLGAYWVNGQNISRPSKWYATKLTALYNRHLHKITNYAEKKEIELTLLYSKTRMYHKDGDLDVFDNYLKILLHSKQIKIKCKSLVAMLTLLPTKIRNLIG